MKPSDWTSTEGGRTIPSTLNQTAARERSTSPPNRSPLVQTEVLRNLRRAAAGDSRSANALFEVLYPQLRRLAQHHLANERPDHTLQATALVHEAYLRLVHSPGLRVQDRVHFFAIASRAMRRILVDHARRRRSAKRNGGRAHLSLDEELTISTQHVNSHLEDLDAALTRLQEEQPRMAQVVEMRFFGGMTEEEIAVVLSVTTRTVRRYWAYSQARLYEVMTRE
jgi:RNA polymerase sigma factor (TIGR02999 family)